MATDTQYNATVFKCLLLFLTSIALNRGKTEKIQKVFNDDQFNKSVPQFLWSDADVHFHRDQWIGTFRCIFQGWPPPEISWHYQDLRIDGNVLAYVNGSLSTSTLTVEAFQEENADEYICLAVNAMGFDDGGVWPNAPPILMVDTKDTVTPGDTITARCIHYPNSNLIWKLPGKQGDHPDIKYQHQSNEVNNTNILMFTAAETDCSATFLCCTKLKNPEKAIYPACAGFSLAVLSKPAVIYYKSCSSDDGNYPKCRLICTFRGYPVPQNISWEYCSVNKDNCTSLALTSEPIIQGMQVTTNLDLEMIEIGFYKCYTNLGDSDEASHTFCITGLQVTPKLVSKNVTTDLIDDGMAVVNFTCTFHSNPLPNIQWYKKDSGWSNGSETISSDNDKFTIRVIHIAPNTYQTTLLIAPYTNCDWSFYHCKAYNENGISKSPPLLAFIIHESLEIKTMRLNNTYQDGETVSVSCVSGGGFPPPYFTFKVVAEHDMTVERSYQENSVNVTFPVSWQNNRIKLECTAVNIFQSLNPPSTSTVIFVAHDSLIIDVHNCSKEDFKNNETCELQCTAQHSPFATEKHHEWIYYTYDVNDTYYVITDNTAVTELAPYKTTYSLMLYNYSAAYYKWHLQYYDPPDEFEELEQVFKIDPTQPGVPLESACDAASDCLALHSLCVNVTCQCNDPYKFPIEMSPNASACVPAAEAGDRCYNNLQCDGHFNCSDSHICECNANYVYVDEINDTDCILSRYYGQICIYNIQCTLSDDQSWCNTADRCDCLPGYQFTQFDLRCEKIRSGLSAAVIFGIIVATLVALILVGCLIQCYRYRLRQRRIKAETRLIWQETDSTNYLTFPTEDSTFTNSTLQFQEQNGTEITYLPHVGNANETGNCNMTENTKL